MLIWILKIDEKYFIIFWCQNKSVLKKNLDIFLAYLSQYSFEFNKEGQIKIIPANQLLNHMMKNYLLILSSALIVSLFVYGCQSRQIFLEYGIGGQGMQLMKFFYDVNDAFYIDIGAYDSIFASNTLNLYTKGWGGINIDANPQRIARFFIMRPDQLNLNYAVGDKQTFSTLYELDEDSSSTVSPKVMQYVKTSKPVVKQIKVPSITLKQLCDRYYFRKPIFMNLDIQGYGGQALLSNDWNNPRCYPQVIFSQINQQTKQSGIQLPQNILKKYGYTKFPQGIGLNQIYIHNNFTAKYQQKIQKSTQYINNLQNMHIQNIMSVITQQTKLPTTLLKHHEPKTDSYFYKFVKNQQIVSLIKLNKQSNYWGKRDRILIILHFHPDRNVLVLEEGNFTTENKKIGALQIMQVNVTKPDNMNFTALILNHNYTNEFRIQVITPKTHTIAINTSKNFTFTPNRANPFAPVPPSPQKPLNLEQQQIKKTIHQFSEMVKNSFDNFGNVSKREEKTLMELKETYTNYHHAEVNLIASLKEKLLLLETKLNNQLARAGGLNNQDQKRINSDIGAGEKIKPEVLNGVDGKLQRTMSSIDDEVSSLIVLLKVCLALVFLMSAILCVSICVLSRQKTTKSQTNRNMQYSNQRNQLKQSHALRTSPKQRTSNNPQKQRFRQMVVQVLKEREIEEKSKKGQKQKQRQRKRQMERQLQNTKSNQRRNEKQQDQEEVEDDEQQYQEYEEEEEDQQYQQGKRVQNR